MAHKIIAITGLLIGIFSLAVGQTTGANYNRMLKTLLKHDVPEISVDSLKKCIDQVILFDAREKKEFDVSHIKGARHVGYEKFSLESIVDIPKNKRIVIYCSVGYRSEKITEKLKAAGYTNVMNLYGGIFEWVNQGNTVVDNTGNPTSKVHAYSYSWGIWLRKGERVYN